MIIPQDGSYLFPWRYNTKQEYLLKDSRLRKLFYYKTVTMEFQILPLADRKRFLLAHCQTINVQSCVTVPSHTFLYWLSHDN